MLSHFASHVFVQFVCFRVNRATSLFQEPQKRTGSMKGNKLL